MHDCTADSEDWVSLTCELKRCLKFILFQVFSFALQLSLSYVRHWTMDGALKQIKLDQQIKSKSQKSTDRKYIASCCSTTAHISSGNNSGAKTSIEYDMDECLDIKEEIDQDHEKYQWEMRNLLSDRNQLDEKCITTEISSNNNSSDKTVIEYSIEKSLDIKEEIGQDQERSQREKHNLLSDMNQLDEKCITTEIPSDSNSGAMTLIEYDYDETLEIKEEIINDQGTISQGLKKFESKLCTLDTRKADIMTFKKTRTSKKTKIQKLKSEPQNKYNCEKCARSYTQKKYLNRHKKFECDAMPQFRCIFCRKQFKQKIHMNNHVLRVHEETNPKASQTRHGCDKCSRSYSSANSLIMHQRTEHAAVSPQFICDHCDHKTKHKASLSTHITSRHLQKFPEKKYKCEKCARSYTQEKLLNRHKKYVCSVKSQFTCEFCGKQFKQKITMNRHVDCVHLKKKSKTSLTRHNCEQCSGSYSSANILKIHQRLEHAAVRQQFICDYCGYKSKRKSCLSTHINSHHFQKFQKSKAEPEKKYKCEKCARSYTQKKYLNRHKKFECDAMPQFRCNFCCKQFKQKTHMNIHILRMHEKTNSKASETRYSCYKCSRSYSCANSLIIHQRTEHAAVRPQFICDHCDYKTKYKASLSSHITSRHLQKCQELKVEPEKKYKCEKCARSFTQKKLLNRHKKYVCSVIPQFTCKFCGKQFKQRITMNRHMDCVHFKTSSKTPLMRHNCDKCSGSYSSANILKIHQRLEHAAIGQQFICDYCGLKCKRKGCLSTHITSHHFRKFQESKAEPEKKYKCEKCARSYTQVDYLRGHKKYVCDVMPQFSCEFCGKRFKHRGAVNRHMGRVHLKTNSKNLQARYNCDKCSRSYISFCALNDHKRAEHAALRPQFVCDHCDHKTKYKSSLSKHIASRHFQKMQISIPKPEKKYECEKCGRSYTQVNHLNSHKKYECDVTPQFSCEFCGKQFKQKGNMNSHIFRMHQKTNSTKSQAKHSCDKCSRSYRFLSGLHDHKCAQHAVVKPQFTCNYCGHKAKRKACLSRHLNSHHVNFELLRAQNLNP